MAISRTTHPNYSKTEIERFEAKAVAQLTQLPIVRLVEMFEHSDNLGGNAKDVDEQLAVAKTRGWLLDALEAKNPVGFTAWCEGDFDGSPRSYMT